MPPSTARDGAGIAPVGPITGRNLVDRAECVFCPMHAGTTDPRELGRLSGKRRREPNPARVHESLRVYLQREVAPERIWQALEAAMLGSNESARVAASKVLMDALAEPARVCPACKEREENPVDVERRLLELLARG